jgi:hypothetical protein
MLEALIAVKATPLPDISPLNVVAVITLAVKEPLESRATIVEAPLAESAEVLALSKVPEEMLEALIAVRAMPLPETDSAVIAPALKDPPASRKTIVAAPLLEVAVVKAFEIVPLVILDALIFVSVEPLPAMLAIKAPTTVTFPGKLAL